MTKITVPGDFGKQLVQTQDCAVLCDDAGQVIGYFTPAFSEFAESYISEEELARREKEEPLYTTEEVLAHLRSL